MSMIGKVNLVKCNECGWRGAESAMKKGYELVAPDDVAPIDRCPACNAKEDDCTWYELKECNEANN